MPRFDVTIAGELNLDLILYGLPDELPRERELLADRMMLTLGSSSAIVAHNLAALGARVGFISRIGDDPDDLWQGSLMEALRYVDVFLPNAREARKIAGTEDAEAALRFLAKRVPLVVMKVGAEGALAQRGEERFKSPAFRVNAVDSIGAGDSFDAGFLHQYLRA